MSLMQEAFRAKLLANGPLSAAVGATRIYGTKLPQDPAYPAITVTRVSAPRDHTMDGQSGYVEARLQVDCWAPRQLDAMNLAELVRLATGGLPATVLGVALNSISLEDDRDLYDDDLEIHGASHDYLVIYNEPQPS